MNAKINSLINEINKSIEVLDKISSFYKDSGTSLIDSSGNNRHGILKYMDTEINRESIL
jgi:hypothetical protein